MEQSFHSFQKSNDEEGTKKENAKVAKVWKVEEQEQEQRQEAEISTSLQRIDKVLVITSF